MSTQLILAFLTYFILLLILGLICHKKQTSSADFMMGNRSLNFWLVALSAHASDMSAWLFMAFPMTIFMLGLGQVWIAIGLLGGMFLNWHFVAPKLRLLTEKYDCYTLSSFFEKRFNDRSHLLRLLSSFMIVIFLTHYLSAGLIAMGFLLESLFGLDYMIGLTITLVVIVAYTFIGGFTTVAWIDLFQGIFLLIVILAVPWIAFSYIEGWTSIAFMAQQKAISLSPWADFSWSSLVSSLLLTLGWGLGYFGMPHIITKFMGIKDIKEMSKSKWLGMSWQTLALGAAIFVGLVSIAFFPAGLEKPELVFVEMVKAIFHPFFAGIILCAVIAANLSTMDSQILVCASTISTDLYRPLYHKEASDAHILWITRISVILISAFSLLLASNKSSTVLDTVLYSWSGLGSAFGPLVLTALYSNFANRFGAVAGIVTGGLTVMVWPTLNPYLMQLDLPPLIPGFFLSLAAIYIVSAMTSKKLQRMPTTD